MTSLGCSEATGSAASSVFVSSAGGSGVCSSGFDSTAGASSSFIYSTGSTAAGSSGFYSVVGASSVFVSSG